MGDRQILQRALKESRIILTHDSDFGALAIAAGQPTRGIIYLRPGHINPAFTLGTLDVVFKQDFEASKAFLIVAARTKDSVRMRIREI